MSSGLTDTKSQLGHWLDSCCHQLGFSEKDILINVVTHSTWLHSAQHFLHSEPIDFMNPGGPM